MWIFCWCPGQGGTSLFQSPIFKKLTQHIEIYITFYQMTSSLEKRRLTHFFPNLFFPRAPTSTSRDTVVWMRNVPQSPTY